MPKTSQEKYLILIKKLPSGEVIDERIIIHFDPKVWAKLEDRLGLDAVGDFPRLKYGYPLMLGTESYPMQFLKVRVKFEDNEIDCEVRSTDTHFEVCLRNGPSVCMEKYAEQLVKAMGKYVIAADSWRLLYEMPSPAEAPRHPNFR